MEISTAVGQQYAYLLPGLVIVGAVLVFVFGFKSSVKTPNFKQLSVSIDDRKSIKKRKLKEKRAQTNGHATVITDDNDVKKQDHSSKTLKQSNKADSNRVKKSVESEKTKDGKKDSQKSPVKGVKNVEKKSGKENQEKPKTKKSAQKITEDKPSDFDEGEWETAFSRKDKKNRKKEEVSTPEKTPKKKSGDKKSPKQDKTNEDKPQSPQNKTPKSAASSPAKKAGESKESEDAKKKKAKTSPKPDEKAGVTEPKSQRPDSKEKKPDSSAKSAKPKDSKPSSDNKGKNNSEKRDHEGASEGQWEEAQKKSKKKVRKD